MSTPKSLTRMGGMMVPLVLKEIIDALKKAQKDQQNKKKPFFLYFAHTFPHIPLAASTAFQGKSIFDLPDYLNEKDIDDWKPLLKWLDKQ